MLTERVKILLVMGYSGMDIGLAVIGNAIE
jgi:hypothetical protein